MALKQFIGFDCQVQDSNSFGSTSATRVWDATTGWTVPPWVFHNKGLAALDQSQDPPGTPTTTTKNWITPRSSGGQGWFYGPWSSETGPPTNYGAATTVTRATWATAQGAQLAINRATAPGGLAGDEYWFAFEIVPCNWNSTDLSTGYEPSTDWSAIFRWGDVQIRAKSGTRNATTGQYTVVLAVRNNGSEVATVTVPYVTAGAGGTNTFIWCLLRVKLHATTGAIEFYANGNAMSSSYTNQNTVATTSNAAATGIFFGPIVFDNGTNVFCGGIDNFLIDDERWPDGVVTVRPWAIASDGTLTNAAAAGTSVTTVTNAIATGTTASYADAKQLRFSAVSGRAEFNMTAVTTTGLGTQVMGFFGLLQRAASRNAQGARKIRPSVEVSSVDYQDVQHQSVSLPFSSVGTPPEGSGVPVHWLVDKSGEPFTTTDLSTAQLVLESVTA